MDGWTQYPPEDPYETHNGPFFWRRTESGGYECAVRAARHHCNGSGSVHGGLLMSLADLYLWQVSEAEREDLPAPTLTFASEFVSAGREGDLLVATGEVVRGTRSVIFVRGQVVARRDDGDRILLTFSGTLKKIKQ